MGGSGFVCAPGAPASLAVVVSTWLGARRQVFDDGPVVDVDAARVARAAGRGRRRRGRRPRTRTSGCQKPYERQVLGDARHLLERARARRARSQGTRIDAAHQDDVAAVRPPQRGARKDRTEGRDDQLHLLGRQRVHVEPLDHQAARLQPAARELVELAREEVAHAGDPDVRGIRDDDVVGLVAGQQRIAAVGDEHATRGSERMPRFSGSKSARRVADAALDVRDVDRADRIAGHRRRRDARAQAEHEDVRRRGVAAASADGRAGAGSSCRRVSVEASVLPLER